MINPPELNFFCELDSQALEELFAKPEVLEFLQQTGATLSMGLLDLSEQRAQVVQRLNQAGVPLTAWLLLPKDQGYWFNLDNHPQALARYQHFKAWTQQHGLQWARIGLDIEPDMRAIQLLTTHRWAGIQRMLRSAINTPRLTNGSRAYHQLVDEIHADGYPVETYQLFFIVDERLAGSRLIQRMLGVVDLPQADREVLMLYSSFMRPWGQGILWSYAPSAPGIGIGSTGGGVDLAGALDIRPLNWAELQNDLLLARQHSQHLYIFSLEGSLREGFLPNLKNFDWQQPAQPPYGDALRVHNLRSNLRSGLWLTANPAVVLFGLAMLVAGLTWLGRRGKK